MKTYQRFFSKSLMFFSILFIVFILFIESNIGFAWMFNITNSFFTELQVKKISGNWRDFLLENIQYNILGTSIRADSIHVKLDMKSLFNTSTIFKEIQTKNLIISFKKDISPDISKKKIFANISNKNIFTKYSFVLKNIEIDHFLIKSSNIKILCDNILTSIKLINNNLIIAPTYIDNINITMPDRLSSENIFRKKNIVNKVHVLKKFTNAENTNNFLNIFSNSFKILIPFHVDIEYLKCKQLKFTQYKSFNSLQLELKANIKNNILKIKDIKINSSFCKIKSFIKIIFHHNSSISSVINSKIIIPLLNNKIIHIFFKSYVKKKFFFIFKSKDFYNFQIHGSVLLNHEDYPFYIILNSNNTFYPVTNKNILNFYRFHGSIKGKINNYFISLKHIFSIKGLPLFFLDIKGSGNFNNISFGKIKCFSLKKNIKLYNEKKTFQHNIKYNQYILKLLGNMNIESHYHNNIKNLCIPRMNLSIEFMKKTLFILGSLYYQSNNTLKIHKMNLLLGKNHLFLHGFMGEKYNLHSSIYAHNLSYFFPNLHGKIDAKVKFYGNYMLPILRGDILVRHLSMHNIYAKNIKIFTHVNIHNVFSGKFLFNAKKIRFYNFHIQNLKIRSNLQDYKQTFDFSLQSKNISIHLTINGIFDTNKGVWCGSFTNLNINTFLGSFITNHHILVRSYNQNHDINYFNLKNIQKKVILSSIISNQIWSCLENFHTSLINFKSKLSIQAKFEGLLGDNIPNSEISVIGYNIKFKKNKNKKIFLENIDFLKIFVNLTKNNLYTRWLVKKNKNSKKIKKIYGYLNIINLYDTKDIKGHCVIINFPFSFLNFFSNQFDTTHGLFKSQIKIFGTLHSPKILADVNFKNIFIRSNNLLKYITLFFPYLPRNINNLRINQEIIMQQGNMLFKLYSYSHDANTTEWSLFFNSKKISLLIFPKIHMQLSSKLNLHYSFLKYDLIGFIKLPFFYFKINEKNFLF